MSRRADHFSNYRGETVENEARLDIIFTITILFITRKISVISKKVGKFVVLTKT